MPCKMEHNLSSGERYLLVTILMIIIFVGGIPNLIISWVLYKERHLRKNIATVFLMNLLVIDLLNLLFVMPFSTISVVKGHWQFSEAFMKFNAILGTTVELVSMLALAIISLDRLAAVMKPLVYRARMTTYKATQLNVYVWVQGIFFSLFALPLDWYIYNTHYGACTFISKTKNIGFYIFMTCFFVCNFVFSLCVILTTYFYIFRVARLHSKKIACAIQPAKLFGLDNVNDQGRRESFRQRELRTASKILFVITAFIICHLPYALTRSYDLIVSYEQFSNVPQVFTILSKWASFAKSAFDPFIYFLLQKRFRRAFSKIILGRKRTRNNGNKDSRKTICSVVSVKGDEDSCFVSENKHKISVSNWPFPRAQIISGELQSLSAPALYVNVPDSRSPSRCLNGLISDHEIRNSIKNNSHRYSTSSI